MLANGQNKYREMEKKAKEPQSYTHVTGLPRGT
jgi:hypothetical protein